MSQQLHVLLVDDVAGDAILLHDQLRDEGYEPTIERVGTREATAEALASGTWDLIVADCAVLGFTALEALDLCRESAPDIPFIVIAGEVPEEIPIVTVRAGAHDYVMKDSLMRLGPAVDRELREVAQRRRRRHIEQALRESEERFRALTESTSDWIWEVDENGRYTYVSPKVEDMLGYEPKEIIGKTPFDFMLPEEAERIAAEFEAVVKAREPFDRLENANLHKDGRTVILETSGVPILDGDGNFQGYRGIDRDITERKQAEEERRSLLQQLFHAQKLEALGTLSAGVAHNFRNLLAIIIALTEAALQQMEPEDKAYDLVSDIVGHGRRGAELVQSLMDFGRHTVAQLEPVNILPIFQETVSICQHTLPENITVQANWPQQLPLVRAEVTLVQQVVINLVNNAWYAMPDGGTLTLELSETHLDEEFCGRYPDATPGNYVRLAVRDTGVGMSPEVQQHIYDPFFSTKGMAEGTGLGLSTVYGIVKSHGGYISVQSEVNKGTQFEVFLPATDERVGTQQEPLTRPPRPVMRRSSLSRTSPQFAASALECSNHWATPSSPQPMPLRPLSYANSTATA